MTVGYLSSIFQQQHNQIVSTFDGCLCRKVDRLTSLDREISEAIVSATRSKGNKWIVHIEVVVIEVKLGMLPLKRISHRLQRLELGVGFVEARCLQLDKDADDEL